eukprot:2883527-Lingulodinium_polyedra.AAC.1
MEPLCKGPHVALLPLVESSPILAACFFSGSSLHRCFIACLALGAAGCVAEGRLDRDETMGTPLPNRSLSHAAFANMTDTPSRLSHRF